VKLGHFHGKDDPYDVKKYSPSSGAKDALAARVAAAYAATSPL
jgi:hypothetical protein